MVREIKAEYLTVKVYSDREGMGQAAAQEVARRMVEAIEGTGKASVLFAAAPSQNDFLSALIEHKEIDWTRVFCFQLDDYHTLPLDAPQRFDNWLDSHLVSKVKPAAFFRLAPEEGMPVEEIAKRYGELLEQYPVDVSCIGIGENAHIAFNDPPVADFDDTLLVKEVIMDEICRNQQVHDGAFPHIDAVPRTAMTMTIPAIVAAPHVSCVVPTALKAKAIYNTVHTPVSTDVPASILRRIPGSVMYVDADGASLL